MIQTLSFLIFFSLSLTTFAGDICPKFTTSLKALNEIPKQKCAEIRDSKQCQDLYQKNSTTMEPKEANRRKLTCDKTAWSIFVDGAIPLPLRGACQAGVANFALDLATSAKNVVVAVGTGIGEGIAYLQIEAEKANERIRKCNIDTEEKKAFIIATISRWPKLMRPTSVPADLLQKDCLNIDLKLREMEHLGKNKLGVQLGSKMYRTNVTLTEDEQEAANYLDPNLNAKYTREQGKSITDMAAELMKKFQDGATCYNSDFQTELYCESLASAASFIIPGMAALRAARLQKLAALAGRSLSNAEIEALGQEALQASKIKSLAARQGVVDKVAELSDADRLELAKKLLGRTLTKEEETAILQAHGLSSDQLLEKARILKEVGFSAEERELFMRTSLTGQPLTKGQQASQLALIQKLSDSPNKTRLLAEIEGASANPDIAKVTSQFQKAAEGYVKDAGGSVAKASGRELGDIEYTASRWGSKATNPADVARAENLVGSAARSRLETEMKSEAKKASARGYPFNQGEYVSDYIQMLRSSPGKGLMKDATDFQIKAIIKEFNSKGWNLR